MDNLLIMLRYNVQSFLPVCYPSTSYGKIPNKLPGEFLYPGRLKRVKHKLPKLRKYDLIWNTFMVSKEIETEDSIYFRHKNFVNRCDIKFVPSDLPKCLTFIPFDNPWNDNMKQCDVIYATPVSHQLFLKNSFYKSTL